MSNNLPVRRNRFGQPNHPSGTTSHLVDYLSHKQGALFVGFGANAQRAELGLEYEVQGSGFGWKIALKGQKPIYKMDAPDEHSLERDELGYTDQDQWSVNSDGDPIDPVFRVGQLYLVRVHDAKRLVFEVAAPTAISEVEDLVGKICWLARDKHPDANPVITIDTRQVRNKKNQMWWVPTLVIRHWNEPDGTVLPPEPEPARHPPGIESTAEPLPDIKPTAKPRQRAPRNAYAHLRRKKSKEAPSTEELIDDAIPY